MTRPILGVDLSIRGTGMSTNNFTAWSLRFSNKKADPKGDQRLVAIRDELEKVILQGQELVISEYAPPYGKGSASLGLVQGILRELCVRHSTPLLLLSPSPLKKFATGNGNADKEAMLKAMLGATDWLYEGDWDDNAIDAWWLRQVGCKYLGIDFFGNKNYDVCSMLKKP